MGKPSPIAGALALALLAVPAGAAEFAAKVSGHDVAVTKADEGERLTVDGREMVSDMHVGVAEIGVVDGTPVVVGTVWAGGNACESAPFILSLPRGGRPRLDGPLDSCFPVTVNLGDERIALFTEPSPGEPGRNWTWTFDDGLIEIEPTPFAPDASRGWAELRERSVTHPGELFGYGEIAAQIERLAGSSLDLVQRTLNGVGSGAFEGNWFVGTGCRPHDCFSEAAIVAASLAERQIYLAWKPEGEKIVVRPPVREWPERARAELREWARQWE